MLGIIIGIASIISIVSTIKGTNDQIKQNLIGSGKKTVKVRLSQGEYEWTADYNEIPAGLIPVPEQAVEKISELDGVAGVTAYNSRYVSDGIYYNDKSVSSLYLYGIDNAYMKTAGFKIRTGRPFMEMDYRTYRSVMLLDSAAAKTLFKEENPLGKEVEIKGNPFTIIGIVEDTNTFEPEIETVEDYYMYKQETNGTAYIPKATWPVVYGFDEPENVIVKAKTTDDMTKIGKKTAGILNEYVNVKDGSIKYTAEDLLGQASQIQQLNSASNRQQTWIRSLR